MKLYTYKQSGNCWKIRMLLSILGLKAEMHELDLLKNEHRTSEYLLINPSGLVPALVDGDLIITDSAEILIYLAITYGDANWLPEKVTDLAKVFKWFTVVGEGVDQGVFAARMVKKFGSKFDYQASVDRGVKLLEKLDVYLKRNCWLAGENISVADLHMYPYVYLAEEGGISLESYINIHKWFDRIKGIPGYIDIDS